MMKLSSVAAACCLMALGASTATADEPAAAPEQAAKEAPAAPATPAAPAIADPAKDSTKDTATPPASAQAANAETARQADEDKRVICKTVTQTGSRVRKKRTCRTKAEWAAISEESQRMMKDLDRKSTPGFGGQSLPMGD